MLLRILIFFSIILIIFPYIFKFFKKLFIKYDEEFNIKLMEEFADEIDNSKAKLKEQIELEESLIKSKNEIINKVKGKVE
jgi:hypothetical protein